MKRLFNFAASLSLVSAVALAGAPERFTTPKQRAAIKSEKVLNASDHRTAPAFAQQLSIKPLSTDEVIQVPFEHTLLKGSAELGMYSAIDANNDERTWKIGAMTTYTACMMPNTDNVDSANDWLVGPGVELKAGVDYIAEFDFGFMGSGVKAARIGLYLGNDATAEAMTQVIAEPWDNTEKDMKTYQFPFTVEADGVYHFGFWACGVRNESFGTVKLANFKVSEGAVEPVEELDLPAAGTITYTVAPKGELKAHVVYTAPTLTQKGAQLERIDKVEIINRWYEKFEFTEVTPGQVIELDVELFQGSSNNRFEGIAYLNNSKGEPQAGESVLVTGIYAGYDNPLPPTNAVAKVSADGKTVTVTWNAPGEVGEHGGYVDVEDLTYYIFDAFGSYYDPAIAYTTETSYTFDYSDLKGQDFVAYQITASFANDSYISLDAATNIVTVGEPDEMPFLESFSDGYYQNLWLIDPETSYYVRAGTVSDNTLQLNSDDEEAEPIYLNSQDGDNGFYYILPIYPDDLFGLISTRVNLAGSENPVLEFWYQGKGSALDVLINSGEAFENVLTIDLKESPTDGWTKCVVDLKPYITAGAIQFELRLRAIHNDNEHTWSVPIDNIRVYEPKRVDLRVASFSVPAKVTAPATAKLTVRVENFGAEAVENAEVLLLRDGQKVDVATIDHLEAGEFATVTFEQTIGLDSDEEVLFIAEIAAEGDENLKNNRAEGVVEVAMPNYPVPANLSASLDGNTVVLNWDDIDISTLATAEPVVEGFEDYPVFAVDSFGDWTCNDLDELKTYTFLGDVLNPYRTQPMAFQVFNPFQSGMDEDSYIDAMPHSGDAMLVAFSAQGQNFNVLISPRLSGEAQTISFWAKSFTSWIPESFTFYYSTTDAELSSFEVYYDFDNFDDSLDVPEDWTEFKAALPEGTVYFAIVHDAYDSYALYLDDIAYVPGSMFAPDTKVTYNIYRDGALVGNAETNTYADEIETNEDKTLNYRVSALYDLKESRLSDPVTVYVTQDGVENISVQKAAPAEYFNLQGIRIDNPNGGIYIRRQAGNVDKTVVK